MERIRKKRLKRPCSKCGKMFTPTGDACRVCDDCIINSRTRRYKK